MTAIIEEDQGTEKAKYARFFWPILRGIALIVALWAFIADLPVFLYGERWGTASTVFVVASFVLIVMTPKPEILPALEGEGTEKRKHPSPPWSLIAYCVITGLGYSWVCAFLWFSRRYAVFSGQVVGAVGLIFAFYAVVGIVVAWLTGGNRRTALLVFALAPCALGGIVLRLGLLR